MIWIGGALERYHNLTEMEAAVANYELASVCSRPCPSSPTFRENRKLRGRCTGSTKRTPKSLAARVCWRGVWWNVGSGSSKSSRQQRNGVDRWDQHAKLKHGHSVNAKATDKPIAALLRDLKARGMLRDTLVLWGGEFGRSAYGARVAVTMSGAIIIPTDSPCGWPAPASSQA